MFFGQCLANTLAFTLHGCFLRLRRLETALRQSSFAKRRGTWRSTRGGEPSAHTVPKLKNILIKIAQQEHPFGLGFLAFWKPWPQVSNPGLKFKALSVFAVKKNHLWLHSRGAGGDSVNVNAPAAVHLPERVEKCLWARKRGSMAEWTACEPIPLIFFFVSRSVDGQPKETTRHCVLHSQAFHVEGWDLPWNWTRSSNLGTVHPCASHDLDPRHRSWCGHLSPVVSANQKSERRAEPQRQMGWSPRKPGMECIFPPKRAEPSQKTVSVGYLISSHPLTHTLCMWIYIYMYIYYIYIYKYYMYINIYIW